MDHLFHYIYKITSKVSNRFYIGMHSTNNILDDYWGSGILIQESIRAHGKEKHTKQILEWCDTREELAQRETELIALAKQDPLCMNLADGGTGGNKINWTPERRALQSALVSAMERTETHRNNIANALRGQIFTEERKQKISQALTGRTLSPQHLESIAIARALTELTSLYFWLLKDPEGKHVHVESLIKFCKEKGFNYNSLYGSLEKGKPIARGTAVGWQLIGKSRIKK